MKASQKLGIMAAIIGLTSAVFGRRNEPIKKRQDGLFDGKHTKGGHVFGGFRHWNPQAIHIPRHGKFKGYMRDNRNWGRKRKAA